MKPFNSILITGGAGFVGKNLVDRLLNEGTEQIHIIDNFLSSCDHVQSKDPRLKITVGSVASEKILETLEDRYDTVFHLSTFHGNINSIADPKADFENNLEPTFRLFERIKNFKTLQKIVYSGAGCNFAEKGDLSKTIPTPEFETVAIDMDSPYSISKVVGEFYSKFYFKQFALPVVRVRFQNVYGPWEILGAGKWRGTPATIWRNVIPTFIYKALKQQALPLENAGQSSRDFIYVADIVEGLIRAAQKGQPGEVYNLCSGQETTIHELAHTINNICLNPTPVELRPRRTWDHSINRFGDPKKSREVLDFSAKWSLRDGLSETITWTREHLKLIEAEVKKHE